MAAEEDAIRDLAEDALAALPGLQVRRMFDGWGFYQEGLLFGAAWDGDFRFRTRTDGRWVYRAVDADLLHAPSRFVMAAVRTITALHAEPAARPHRSGGR